MIKELDIPYQTSQSMRHLYSLPKTLRLCLGVWRGRKGKALRGAKYEEKE
jgi:hypothetical protein